MKKSMILTACLSIFFMHAMEKTDHFSIVLYGTIIDVSTKFLSNIVDIKLVAGQNDQCLLRGLPTIQKDYIPGRISYQNRIWWKNEDPENNYRDDTWKFFGEENRSEAQNNIINQPTNNEVIVITEPCIALKGYHNNPLTNTLIPTPQYKVIRFDEDNGLWLLWTFYGNEAISEASKDLALCYEKVLKQGTNTEHRNIAIPTLGADVGFPHDKAVPIALTSIINFLRNYTPSIYDRIELVVRKRSEFAAYKKFLINYWQKPCLLILAHKDENHFLYTIPREIMDFILFLMHPTTYC